jgi:hypothetical protein
MEKIFTIYVLFILVIAYSITTAQSKYPNLFSDRLGVTQGPIVLPQNLFQIESGVSYQIQKYKSKNSNYEIENITLGSTLFRYGINEKLELRFGGGFFSGRTTINDVSVNVQGLQNIFLGSKIQLLKNKNLISNAGIILELGLPFGNENFRPARIEPGIILTLDKYFIDALALGINLGARNNSNLGKNIYSFSTLMNYELNKILGVFAEYYSNIISNELAQHNFDCGVTYRVRKNILVDCSAGSIIAKGNSNWCVKFGVSLRLPD